MNYLSVCSGIEAASVAWRPLGWTAAAFSEIEPFPCAVLAHHYPDVPNLGDMTKYKEWNFERGSIDLLVGGTPCQSFSVAGLRAGLDDPRGNLMLVYLDIARRFAPAWVVWENVPGVLSSNRGRDFGTFLGGLAECGYGFAYRVLDAQFFGVPQQRRRVFVVGYLGDWRRAAAVLFERESLRGYPPPSREAGKRVALPVTSRVDRGGEHREAHGNNLVAGTLFASGAGMERPAGCASETSFLIAHPVTCHYVKGGDPTTDNYVAHALRADGFDASEDGTGRGTPPVAQTITADMYRSGGATAGNNHQGVRNVLLPSVRRLTPIECERLQGFPDGYTNILWGRKSIKTWATGDNCADGPRYKALGNSMATVCMGWLGRRIDAVRRVIA